ncbi:carbon-nitrogen hydrolase family protein [Pseudomonas syringae]|uniref:Carbon-nitrogen hydrolase n=1 Tax=Pseudomonas syringae TaxID=317 RepID=A0A085VHP3_PSESX|nr:carbon-nitrogen hydrolase family protein [Pseudomonas syringae]KFE54956.1 carbon-nitrogen hydrolase [Pseudomonas syringae]
MRTFFTIVLGLGLIVALAGYGIWTEQRPVGHYLSDLRIQLAVDEGQPSERGNMLGIQPELFPADYQSIARLHRKLAAYLQQARDQGLINSRTLVVLPEHVGTWLFASGEKNQVYEATTIDEAMTWVSASNPLKFIAAMMQAKGDNRLDDAHLRMKAPAMAADYQTLFGGLAREFGVTLVAGSIVLPEPSIDGGKLKTGSGPLYNSSVAFGSDGLPIGQPQRQLFPNAYQRNYIHAAGDTELNVFDTPAGRLGILIGSDSWYPGNYASLNAKGAELIAVPAFVIGADNWARPWRGYRTPDIAAKTDAPADVSEGEAWQRLTLTSQAPISTARAGISVFMRGQLWDQGSSGHSFASRDGQHIVEPLADDKANHGARLINIWL